MLDLGCGAGRFVAALRDAGADAVGVELAEAALERARRNVPGADFRSRPTAAIPLGHGEVDLVWCSEVLEHVPDTVALPDRGPPRPAARAAACCSPCPTTAGSSAR